MRADDAGLYLLTRGQHCDAPVILWLHGGPGGAEGPLFRLYNSAIEETFVVAYWDQRGAGRSYDADADPARLTVAQHLEDLDLVVDHLRARLRKDRVVLMGHSWGSALGLLYARRHPEKVAAFVGVAQFVSGIDGQRAQYAFVEAEARRLNDRTAQTELFAIGEPPYSASNVLRVQGLVDRFGGYFHARPSFLTAVLEGVVRGYVAPWEIGKFIRANNVSLEAMNDEILGLDLRQSVPSVDVPVVFMLGRYDRQLDSRIAFAYFEQIRAPRKSLVWFEHSAHNISFEEPQLFNLRVTQALDELRVHPVH
ncbi:MAG: alpha/beta hydrolase [Methylocystis silviterrae]